MKPPTPHWGDTEFGFFCGCALVVFALLLGAALMIAALNR